MMDQVTRRAATLVLDAFDGELLDDDGVWEARLANAARRPTDVVVPVVKAMSAAAKRKANREQQSALL